MDIQVNGYNLPEVISFNYDEIKSELISKVEKYSTIVYDDDQIKEAKADKAQLNKLKKALNDERIRQEKEYMKPFTDFKAKVNDLIKIIDEPVSVIDSQVKAYEEKAKERKLDQIKSEFESLDKPDFLTFEKVFKPRWLNSSVSMKAVKDDLEVILIEVQRDLETLSFSFEAQEIYKDTLDLNKAITEGRKLEAIAEKKKQAEAEKPVQEEKEVQEVKEEKTKAEELGKGPRWMTFSVYVTDEDIEDMLDYFDRNLIPIQMPISAE